MNYNQLINSTFSNARKQARILIYINPETGSTCPWRFPHHQFGQALATGKRSGDIPPLVRPAG